MTLVIMSFDAVNDFLGKYNIGVDVLQLFGVISCNLVKSYKIVEPRAKRPARPTKLIMA
jgi:hypothetical protein